MDYTVLILFCLSLVTSSKLVGAQNEGDVRLVGGTSAMEGRVEIYHNNVWGTVCDNYWDFVDATVVCRQLGYDHANGAPDRAHFGEGSSSMPVYLDHVKCLGPESKLSQCYHTGWGVTDCGHGRDASVICTNAKVFEGEVRLSDGARLEEGRVEIYHAGLWGTVCNDFWGKDEARVVCYQLGYNGYTYYKADYGNGVGPIHLDNVDCFGYESSLIYCYHSSWGVNDCSHDEDVGVRCSRPGSSPRMSWWLWFIIVSCSFCALGIVIGIFRACCQRRNRKGQKPDGNDPAATDPMMTLDDTMASSAQIYVPSAGGGAPSVATFVPLQPYPPAQPGAGLAYPPAANTGLPLPYPPTDGGMPTQPSAVPPTYDESQQQPSQSQTNILQASGQPTTNPTTGQTGEAGQSSVGASSDGPNAGQEETTAESEQ